MIHPILTRSILAFAAVSTVQNSVLAIAPIDIHVPSPDCPDGYNWHDALKECRPIDIRFQLPKSATPFSELINRPTSPRQDIDSRKHRASGRKITSLPDTSDSCTVPPGALPVCSGKSEQETLIMPFTPKESDSNPYMGDREGTPPSAGAGSR